MFQLLKYSTTSVPRRIITGSILLREQIITNLQQSSQQMMQVLLNNNYNYNNNNQQQRQQFDYQPQLVGIPNNDYYYDNNLESSSVSSALSSNFWETITTTLWLAVPKSKVTRSKKRMKTTVQKRISYKHNISVDPRTGEIALLHKLPFNWKDYLPSVPDNYRLDFSNITTPVKKKKQDNNNNDTTTTEAQ